MSKNSILWHPYPKEKPHKNGGYNVTFVTENYSGRPINVVTTAFWRNEAWEWYDFAEVDDVIAWAELPEPYTEVDE